MHTIIFFWISQKRKILQSINILLVSFEKKNKNCITIISHVKENILFFGKDGKLRFSYTRYKRFQTKSFDVYLELFANHYEICGETRPKWKTLYIVMNFYMAFLISSSWNFQNTKEWPATKITSVGWGSTISKCPWRYNSKKKIKNVFLFNIVGNINITSTQLTSPTTNRLTWYGPGPADRPLDDIGCRHVDAIVPPTARASHELVHPFSAGCLDLPGTENRGQRFSPNERRD